VSHLCGTQQKTFVYDLDSAFPRALKSEYPNRANSKDNIPNNIVRRTPKMYVSMKLMLSTANEPIQYGKTIATASATIVTIILKVVTIVLKIDCLLLFCAEHQELSQFNDGTEFNISSASFVFIFH
jgi:hypothetical protein